MRATLLPLALLVATIAPAMADELSVYQATMLEQLKPMLPKRLDDVTLITGFTFSGQKIVYHYEVAAELRAGLDVAAYRAEKFDDYCGTMRSIYKEAEVTAMEHVFVFAGGQEVTLGVTMDECQAAADANRKAFFEFAREQSGK